MPFKCGKHASDFLGMSILGAFLIIKIIFPFMLVGLWEDYC